MVKILYFVLVFPVFFGGVFSFLDCINGENIIFCTGFFFWNFFLFLNWINCDGLMVNITFV